MNSRRLLGFPLLLGDPPEPILEVVGRTFPGRGTEGVHGGLEGPHEGVAWAAFGQVALKLLDQGPGSVPVPVDELGCLLPNLFTIRVFFIAEGPE